MKIAISPIPAPATIMSALFLSVALTISSAAQEPGATYDEQALLEAGELGDKIQGEDTAPVTIIEYASMTCPHCASFHKNSYPKIKQTLSLIHISEPTRHICLSRMPSSA
mgnify:CR=1 FL=1